MNVYINILKVLLALHLFLPYAVYNTAFKEFNMVFPSADRRQVVMTECICAGVDGWLARRLGQSSRFGAWLDVVVDNVGRGMLWSRLFKVSRSNPPPFMNEVPV